jgi:hypothetical protein
MTKWIFVILFKVFNGKISMLLSVVISLIAFHGSISVANITNIGPLTTTFTPSPTCFDVTAVILDNFLYYAGPADVYAGTFLTPNPVLPCFPSYSALAANLNNHDPVFFSPGICPQGYSTANSTTSGDETQATCCPTGYVASFSICSSFLSAEVTASARVTITITSPPTGTSVHGPYLITTYALIADAIYIRYKAIDFPSSASITPGPTTTSTISRTGITTSTISTPAAAHIPSGSIAGIAIGSLLGAILLFLGAVLLLRRWRRPSAKNQQNHHELQETTVAKYELHGDRFKRAELDSSTMGIEGEGNYMPNVVAELPVSRTP